MRSAFTGAFAPYICGLIEKKQALGYDYHGSACILRTFDEFCREQFPNETCLTAELAMKWAAQFKHIFGQDNDSVFMSFRFKDIHRPIKQVDILSSEPSGFYGSETATVDQAKYYRYHQMLCGCSKAGLQRIYFLEQLGQIFL